jgi:hypothetical protein
LWRESARFRSAGERYLLRDESASPSSSRNEGCRHDLHVEREILRHPSDHRELLEVLLAEHGERRMDEPEEPRHHGRDAVEVSGSRRAIEPIGELSDMHRRRVTGRVEGLLGKEQQIHAFGFTLPRVALGIARVAR